MLKSSRSLIGIAAGSVLLNAALAISLFRMRRRAELLAAAREKATADLQNLQQAFHQFAPQRVVEDVIKRGVSTSGETRQVTVLFADIVEFTALSESLSPETLVRILNGYFEAASTAVTPWGSRRQVHWRWRHGHLWCPGKQRMARDGCRHRRSFLAR